MRPNSRCSTSISTPDPQEPTYETFYFFFAASPALVCTRVENKASYAEVNLCQKSKKASISILKGFQWNKISTSPKGTQWQHKNRTFNYQWNSGSMPYLLDTTDLLSSVLPFLHLFPGLLNLGIQSILHCIAWHHKKTDRSRAASSLPPHRYNGKYGLHRKRILISLP